MGKKCPLITDKHLRIAASPSGRDFFLSLTRIIKTKNRDDKWKRHQISLAEKDYRLSLLAGLLK